MENTEIAVGFTRYLESKSRLADDEIATINAALLKQNMELSKQIEGMKNALHQYENRGSCEYCAYYREGIDGEHCAGCTYNAQNHFKPMSNRDYLESLDTEELAELLVIQGFCLKEECDVFGCEICDGQTCTKKIESWLARSRRSESDA